MSFTELTGGALCSGGIDDLDVIALSVLSSAGAISRSTAWPQTGNGCVAHDQTTDGNKAISPLDVNSKFTVAGIRAFSFAAAVSATPSSAAGLLWHFTTTGAPTAANGYCHIRVETDLKLGIYDKNGALMGKSATAVPSGASGTPQEFCVIFDGLTMPSVFVTIFAGDAVDASFDTGLSWSRMFNTSSNGSLWWGEYLEASTNRGCTVFIDDGVGRRGSASGDGPHAAAYPRIRVSEPVNSTTIGAYNAWDSDDGAGGIDSPTSDPTYIDNGELPTHDGDSSYLQSTTASEAFTVTSTDANPIPSGATIIKVEQRHVGRLTGGGKVSPNVRHRLGGTDADDGTGSYGSVGTSYVGMGNSNIARPGGGSWVDTDFAASTLEWGLVSSASTPGYRVTLMLGPSVAYYTDTLPLSRTPTSDASIKLFRRRFVDVPAKAPDQLPLPAFVGILAQPAATAPISSALFNKRAAQPPAPAGAPASRPWLGVLAQPVVVPTSPISPVLFGKPWTQPPAVSPTTIPRAWHGIFGRGRRRYGYVA